MDYNNKYLIDIFERYLSLKNSNKQEFDNNDLWKIFEYYSCIKLTEEYKRQFYEYDDIEPTFKEQNKMSKNDTGIDCSDLINTIVQCKLRKNSLTWKECSTFFGSQVIFSSELNKPVVRWDNLIITRNNDCVLSENLLARRELFIDKVYSKEELIAFCENLILNPPVYSQTLISTTDFKLRDYQIEAINIIKQNKSKNTIISLPTGTGKNSVIIYSIEPNKKYLILVPRIILMDQFKKELIKHKPLYKSKIQLIGDTNIVFDENKLITICVFNSVHLIEQYCSNFEKIFIDEAHHILKPAIYYENELDDEVELDTEAESDTEINDILNNLKWPYMPDNIAGINYKLIDDFAKLYYSVEDVIEKYYKQNLESDSDEKNVVNKYTTIIKKFAELNNNVYLSATIDQTDNFEYYNKDIRTMIELKYLCDYTIHIPIFSDDPTNKNICEYLLKNYRNIIIYCNSQTEGKQINKLMNELQLNSSEYIDCNTSKKTREMVIEKYKNGNIPFIVNVKILVEGFDAPITKGVCFLHLPNSKTTLIQIIGRALRLHENKTIANIILPYSTSEDEKSINNFLKIIAKNDSRIRTSYENKKLGGYIEIELPEENDSNNTNSSDDDSEISDIEFKFNMIYNSMGKLTNGEEIWTKRLEEVKEYIDANKMRPARTSNNSQIVKLGTWISTQVNNYKKRKDIMKNQLIYDKWSEFINDPNYNEYFMSNEEIWIKRFEELKQYIDNNKKPSKNNDNPQIKCLAMWCINQITCYKKKDQIMKHVYIYNKWTEFINNEKYKQYFLSNEDVWNNTFEEVLKHIKNNNKLPSRYDNNIKVKQLGTWFKHQQQNYRKKKDIMKNELIFNKWTQFINDKKYKQYFMSNENSWNETLNEAIKYINLNKKRPSEVDKNIDIKKIAKWIQHQITNYKKKQQIMKNQEYRNKWANFIIKYNQYFDTSYLMENNDNNYYLDV